MLKPRIPALFWILLAGLALAACSLAGVSTPIPPTSAPDAAYTQAAQTIIAELTRVAGPSTPLPPSDATLTAPPAGATLPAATPTETPLPTETSTPENTPTPVPSASPTASPTPTTISSDPRQSLGNPSWRDTFNSGRNWYLYEDEHASFVVNNNGLVMTSISTGYRNAWMMAVPSPKNFYLEVTANPRACSGKDRYGVMFRSDSETGYLFGFSCDGEYFLYNWNGEKNVKLVDWTASPYILSGPKQINRLGIMVNGDHFSLYANGNLLTEVKDDTYKKGSFGLFIGAQETENFKTFVSEVDYWELP